MTSPDPGTLARLERPFYLVDLPALDSKYDLFLDAFSRRFDRVVVALSYKTAYVPMALRHLHGRGAWAEVVSDLEYALALRLAVPPEHIVYNGPGKSRASVGCALSNGSLVNLDSLEEVGHAVAWKAAHPSASSRVGLRVNISLPDVGGGPSRFGIEARSGQVEAAAEQLSRGGLELACLHAHLTSRNRTLVYFRDVARALCEAAFRAGAATLPFLDVGGGYGYSPPGFRLYDFPAFPEYADAIADEFRAAGISCRTLVAEPGIALFGDAVSLYSSVIATKELAGRHLCVLDASVQTVKPTKHAHTLPTTAFDHDLEPRRGDPRPVDLVGYTCLEDDVIARDVPLPALQTGDILRIDNVGAYTFVFKPQFIRGMPAFYVWNGEEAVLARRADTFDDVFGAYVI
ncbi:MAG: hypothetical protein HY900_14250 [Deltaproteobacteria bacterium]|nr:hypothetical protein [Deltaproteobacteria bacterium]